MTCVQHFNRENAVSKKLPDLGDVSREAADGRTCPEAGHVPARNGDGLAPQDEAFYVLSGARDLQSFFRHAPDNSGMAFVVIPHLPKELKNGLGELLSEQEFDRAPGDGFRDNDDHAPPSPRRGSFNVKVEFSADNEESQASLEYENLLAALPMGVFQLDSELRIRRVNQAAVRMLGLLPQDAGRPVEHVLNPLKDKQRFMDELRLALAGGQVMEGQVDTIDGLRFETCIRPSRDREGAVMGVLLTLADITAVKKSEALLHEAEILKELATDAPAMAYRLLVDSAGNGRFVYVSDQSWDIFGLCPEDLLTQPEKLKAMFEPVDMVRFRDTILAAGQDMRPFEFEFPLRTASGGPRWVLMRNSPKRLPDGSVVWNGVALDNTGRTVMEQRRRDNTQLRKRILDEAPVLIWRSGRDGACDWHNRAWLEFRGRNLETENTVGWEQSVHPEDLAEYMAVKRDAFASGSPFTARYRLLRHDGQYRWIAESGKPFEGTDSIAPGYHGFCHDIHDLMETAEELGTALKRAQKAVQTKNDFLVNTSHEIRTLISAVVYMSQMTLSLDPGEEVAKNLRIIEDSAESLLDILNDVLDFAKIQVGRLEISEADFTLRDELEKTLKPFVVACEQKGVEFQARVSEDTPEFIRADPVRIAQVLRNLVSNAVKFTDAGRIEIDIFPHDGRMPSMLEFSVRDTGAGIPADKQGSLFTAFTQLDTSYASRSQGTGLGLAISKKLVEAMGGSIWVSSREGEGSVFSFTVGIKPAESAGKLNSGPDAAKPGAAPDSLEGIRVLLAEDNKVNQLFLNEFLESLGCRVACAENGNEVLEALRQEPFDAVLMDIQMPGLDGIEATRCIRSGQAGQSAKNIPVVALTAHAMKGDREKFISLGMDDYLSKPVDIEELQRVLVRLLAGQPAREPETRPACSPARRDRLAFLGEVYATFVANSRQWLDELDISVGREDWGRVADIAHSILSITIPLRTGKLYEHARLLQQAAWNQDAPGAREALAATRREIRHAHEIFQEFLASSSGDGGALPGASET